MKKLARSINGKSKTRTVTHPKNHLDNRAVWVIQKPESCFHVMAQLVTEMGLVWHPWAPFCWHCSIRRVYCRTVWAISWIFKHSFCIKLNHSCSMVRTVSEKKGQSQFAGSRCPVTDDQVIFKLIHKLVSLQISRMQCPAAIASPSVLWASALSTWFPLHCPLLYSVNLPKVTKDLPNYIIVPDKIDTIVVLFDKAISKAKYSTDLACSN